MPTGYHHITYRERLQLEAYLKAGKSKTWIAQTMRYCRKTIYNEIKRGEYEALNSDLTAEIRYSADKAQQLHDYNATSKGRPLKIGNDFAFAEYIEHMIIENKYSPAAALAASRRAGYNTEICVTTLYNYIEKKVFLNLNNSHLWEKSKKKTNSRNKRKRIAHPLLPSILERPIEATKRTEEGHKEMDLIVGKKGTNSVLLTLTDRKKSEELIIKLPNKKAASVRAAFDNLERKYGKEEFRRKFKTITTDNGSEFLEYNKLIQSIYGGERFKVYYCHSCAAWEKGTNENHNRMIRRFFPKGTNFDEVSDDEIKAVEDWMNHYPRKKLGWKAPCDIAG